MATTIATPATLPADRFYRTALFCLVLTSVVTLVASGKLDPMTVIVVPTLVLLKGYRWWRSKPVELQHKTATRMVLAYLLVFPVDLLFFSRTLAGDTQNPGLYAALLASVHFLLFVTVVRLYSATTDRDGIFLSMLAFAGVLASAVFTVDTSFLIFFLVFLLFAVAVFVGLEIRKGALGAVFPALSANAYAEGKFYKALSLATLSLSLGALALGSVLFFVFPRFSAGYFARSGMQPALMSGFTDSVVLGQIGEIKKNTTVVMRVQTGSPIKYPLLRWRGIALTTFDGRRWYTHDTAHVAKSPDSDGWITLGSRVNMEGRPAAQVQFLALLQPMASDAIFAPSQVFALRGNFATEETTYASAVRHSFLRVDSTGSIYNQSKNVGQIRYEGVSLLPIARPTAARFAGTDYSEEMRETYLQLPEQLDPRIPELARKITVSANNPYDKSLALEAYLRSHFGYTLRLAGKPGADPLAHFLFEAKAGHCEYFASSMAVMLRTLGIPSREVNGFLPGEYNDVGGDYIVRASDAHSWVEAYFPGNGWLTFDPTPGASAASGGIFSRLALYLDWFQLAWNEWVINYDISHQTELARNVGQTSLDWKKKWERNFRRMQNDSMQWLIDWQKSHSSMRSAFPVVLVVGLILLRLGWVWSLVRWLRLRWETSRPAKARNNPQLAARLYGELLRLLEARGFSRKEAQTPREFAASFAVQPALAPAVREFTDLYLQARFGGSPCNVLRLRALMDDVKSAPHPD
jgi:transglutaminase-like putative cysteine protease